MITTIVPGFHRAFLLIRQGKRSPTSMANRSLLRTEHAERLPFRVRLSEGLLRYSALSRRPRDHRPRYSLAARGGGSHPTHEGMRSFPRTAAGEDIIADRL